MRLLLLLLLAAPVLADEAADMMLFESLQNSHRHSQLMNELRRQRETPVQPSASTSAPTVIYTLPSTPTPAPSDAACRSWTGGYTRACIDRLMEAQAAP